MTGWLARDPLAAAPLSGVRVLDFSELLPGPFMTQSLVELGADVLKVERPPHGDNARRLAPALFEAVNRGKRSLQADLKDAAQRHQLLLLADQADVLVASFRPGVIERLGFGWDALQARNPRLVHVTLTGYGDTGPRALWPGHDINYLASAGVVALAGDAPSFGVPMADLAGAVYALAAVNAALVQRANTGRGQRLDVSLTDCVLHWMNTRLPVLRHAGATALPVQRALVQQRPGYGVFRCRDGGLLSLGALEDHFWQSLVATLGLQLYAGDAFRSYRQRQPAAAAINAAVAAALAQWDRADAVQRLMAADVPVAEVTLPGELPGHPQFVARGLFADSAAGPLCRFPVMMQGMPEPPRHSPPLAPASP